MVPNKVVSMKMARKRLAKARRPKLQITIFGRAMEWLTSRTTKGTVLLAGVLAGLIMGAMVAAATSSVGNTDASAYVEVLD